MTHFPHRHNRPAAAATAATTPTALGAVSDVLWGRPVFRAPQLNPRLAFDPLPFTATRITRQPGTRTLGA